ncbi:MAG: hypothetical protein ACXVG8_18970 [Oryzihumus sp.]
MAVRADAEAVWLPRRTAAEHIGALVSLDVTVRRPGMAPTVHRTLTGHRARRLADIVNHLAVRSPGLSSCPNDPGYTDVLVFHVDGPDVVVRADATGCATVQLTVSHRGQPSLQGGSAVDAAVSKALHLPTAYDLTTVAGTTTHTARLAVQTGVAGGRLLVVGGPAPGAPRPLRRGTVTFTGATQVSVRIDHTGHYSARLPVGSYEVSGRSPEIGSGSYECHAAKPINVAPHARIQADVYCQVK